MANYKIKYYSYRSANKNDKSKLEKSFSDLKRMIELYEKQYDITLELYRSEWKNETSNLTKQFDAENKSANKEYNRIYDELKMENANDGDYELWNTVAMQESGLIHLDQEYEQKKQTTTRKYKDYFDLYSKSLLIALYSLVESKLKEICNIIAIDERQRITYDHLNSRDYLNTSFNYIDLVLQIPIVTLKPFKSKFKDIQFVRNRIVHSGSSIPRADKDGQIKIMEIVRKSKGSLRLIKNSQFHALRINDPKYIINYILLIREFFEELIWLIDIRQNNKILKRSLGFWFGILDKNIFVKILQTTKLKKGKRKIIFKLSSRKKNIPKFNCSVNISRATKNSVDTIDQTGNDTIKEFNNLVNDFNSFLYNETFELFNQSNKGIKIEVLMYP